ncbi:MAG: hypothetical protein JXQ73_29830 [Phycisphaerae bacterium]|nr:hypothetical protein [Phycisphaerae bacterium]
MKHHPSRRFSASVSADRLSPGILKRLLPLLCVALAGCLPDPLPTPARDATKNTADFMELQPISFSFQNPGSSPSKFKSSRARIFYSYHPADVDPASKPLFVMLNGGPGCATTLNLFANNTAPYTLNYEYTDGNLYAKNANSWTRIGNLLYIDAPNTGFSYELVGSAWWLPNRAGEFGVHNYNPLIDAAQVVRVILQFLQDHSAIKNNPVVLVGESYAGTRVSTMLNLLLFHQAYGDGSRIYRDDALVELIDAHFRDQLSADSHDDPITPERVAAQFGRQILIQPQLTGPYETEIAGDMFEAENSIIDQILGYRYSRCGYLNPCALGRVFHAQNVIKKANHDVYNYMKPKTWSDDLEVHATEALLDTTALSKVLGVDARSITWLKPAARRSEGYRYVSGILGVGPLDDDYALGSLSPSAAGGLTHAVESIEYIQAALEDKAVAARPNSLERVLGKLRSYDDYLSGTNQAVYLTFQYNWGTLVGYDISPDRSPIYGEMFLQNLAFVRTFITDAAYDLMIYSPALPAAFRKYTGIVAQVDIARGDETTDGEIIITYLPGALELAGITTPDTRTVYWPHYASSGHSVSSTEPDKLLLDVTNWLALLPVE